MTVSVNLTRILFSLTLSLPLLGAQCSLKLRLVDFDDVITSTDLVIKNLNDQSFEVPSSIEDKVLRLPCAGYYIIGTTRNGVYPIRIGPLYLKSGEHLDFLLPISHAPSHTRPKDLQFETRKIPGTKATVLIRYETKLSTPLGIRYSGEALQVSIGRLVFTGGTIQCDLKQTCELIGKSRVTIGMKTVGFGRATISAKGIVVKTLDEIVSFSLSEANALP